MSIQFYRRIMFCAFVFVLIGGSCGRNPQSTLSHIKIGIMPIIDLTQVYVADAKGYFREAGMEVELVNMAGGAVIAPAIEKGDLDIGWSNTVSIAIARKKGLDFIFLAPGSFNNAMAGGQEVGCMMLPINSKIQSPAELDGKLIAINTRGNISELIVRVWAAHQGLNPDRIQFSEIPYPDMEAALSNDRVDAALVWEPYVTKALINHSARTLDCHPMSFMGEKISIANWFAKQAWIDQHPKEVNAFMTGIRKANNFIVSNPEETRQIVARYTQLDVTLAKEITFSEFPSKWDLESVQRVLDFSFEYHFLEQSMDASAIVSQGNSAP